MVKLVNYTRSEVKKGHKVLRISSKSVFQDDHYLLPVLEDDALLFSLDEVICSPEALIQDIDSIERQGHALDDDSTPKRVRELHDELLHVQQQFKAYRAAVDETLETRWNNEDAAARSSQDHVHKIKKADRAKNDESDYFTSYSYNGQPFREVWRMELTVTRNPRDNVKGYYSNRRLSRFYIW